ncbi:hypothetical protein OVA26_16180 [Microbacterium sp. SL62]|uniref:hypothetical protein n=1 Tax=Microbacterium sp. SL62 TaxID=2995139 RepID=UPI002274123A|nr:hypothetical protein [Microbacterium sp. SL62]MCY1718474.1 hypothetical protein [Microbacterium sp. SL62]
MTDNIDNDPKRIRKSVRLHPDTVVTANHWARKLGLTETEYLVAAIEEKNLRMSGDFDIPHLGIQRLNQLIDEVHALSTNAANLERVTTSGFSSIIRLTQGDNYLHDPEDGELASGTSASAAAGA